MKDKLLKLAKQLESVSLDAASKIYKLAGRHDKVLSMPIKIQPAYKYIMYLKLMHKSDNEERDDRTFHTMKRRYIDTSTELQQECQEELDKLIMEDAAKQKIPSSTVIRNFNLLLKEFENNPKLWEKYFETKLGKRSN